MLALLRKKPMSIAMTIFTSCCTVKGNLRGVLWQRGLEQTFHSSLTIPAMSRVLACFEILVHVQLLEFFSGIPTRPSSINLVP